MILTKENYFSLEANQNYMSVSQFKDFAPAFGGCEAGALAKVKGEYTPKPIQAFVEGHYVHAWNEGSLEDFKANNPEIYASTGKNAGQLKSEYQRCNRMIHTLESDPLVMQALDGQKEVIMTAELFGIEWKVMVDSYNPELGIFTDLKTLKDMDSRYWNSHSQCFENFLDHYGYKLQMSVYAEVERRSHNRENWLIPHMVVITKQDPPDHEVIYFDSEMIEQHLNIVRNHIERVKLVKSGQVIPERCENCDYCRLTKKVKRIRHYSEFNLY